MIAWLVFILLWTVFGYTTLFVAIANTTGAVQGSLLTYTLGNIALLAGIFTYKVVSAKHKR